MYQYDDIDDNFEDLFEELFGERPEPVQEGQQLIDLDTQVPLPVQPPADEWVETLNDAKDEFEVDGCTYRTREAHESLQVVCQTLGDPTIAEKDFG